MAERRYWDTTTFFAWLANQADRADKCKRIVDWAERGEIEIVTSALTIAEVLWMNTRPGDLRLKTGSRGPARDFFRHEYVVLVEVDRIIAENAQELVWDYGVPPKDAIHLASAIRARVKILDTFDSDQLNLDGVLPVGESGEKLSIAEPYHPPTPDELQEKLFDEEEG